MATTKRSRDDMLEDTSRAGLPFNATAPSRFAAKVAQCGSDECWIWLARISRDGYGQFRVGGKGTPNARAHRVAWELANGPIPAGLLVCHTCDNPPCCNPAHLFLGTPADNSADIES